MRRFDKTDFGVGLAIVLGCLYFFYLTGELPQEISHIPGPALFPRLILGLLAVLGGITIWGSFRTGNKNETGEPRQVKKDRRAMRNVIIFVGYILAYGFSVWAGLFVYSTPGFIFLATWTLLKFTSKPIPYVRLLMISLGLSASLYLAFVKILHVPLQ